MHLGQGPHIGTFNVEFCLYSIYVGPYITAGTSGSASHLYRMPLLLPHAPTILPHSIFFIEQVCSTVRPCTAMPTKGGIRGLLRLGTNEPPHCTTCTLLPCSHSPYDVLHSPSYYTSILSTTCT